MEIRNSLKSFFTDYWKYLAVSAACKLNIFDTLEVDKSANQIANELELDKNKTAILLNALNNIGYLDKIDNMFSLNENSVLLTENHPESLKYACLNWQGEHMTAWQNLDYSVKTGNSSFENIFGQSYFSYLNNHPEKLKSYQHAMYEYAKDDYKYLPEIIDFSVYKSIMDVGGGYGAAIESIKRKNPGTKCYILDLEGVVSNISNEEIIKTPCDFFDPIPKLAKAIILSRVIHDWDDEKAQSILSNCYNALPENGTLYLIENCSDKIDMDLSLLSLNMLVMCNSLERTSTEYISLCN